MFKPLNIMLCFLTILAVFQLKAQDNFKVFVPEFIPQEGSFEVSIITSKKFPEAERLDIYFFPDISLTLTKVELWSNGSKLQIPLHSEFFNLSSERSLRASISLIDSTIFTPGSFFQLVIHLTADEINSNSMKFYGEYIGGQKILGYLLNNNELMIPDQPNFYRISFNYFEIYSTSKYAAHFSRISYLNIPLVYKFDEVLLAEFWMKLKNFNSTFLNIINRQTNRIKYSLSINENQMLIVNSDDNTLFQKKPIFISNDTWYHFNLNFDKSKSELSFYCSNEEFAKVKIQNSLTFENLVLHFQDGGSLGILYLDQFRLVVGNNSPVQINNNKNYADYSDAGSKAILQINFLENELNNLVDQKLISFESIKLVKSDAPIFPRAPEINVKLLNNFYEIEWKGGDFLNADHYVLEKAIDNDVFQEVGMETADNTEKKVYSLIYERSDQPEVAYFRIRQINKDGSSINSDVVKVGQGIVEDVVIGQNFPNPFNPITLIEFELLQDSDVDVKVFNLAGKEVALLHKGFLSRGIYQFKFDAKGLSSGIYIYQINTPYSSQTRKMILAK